VRSRQGATRAPVHEPARCVGCLALSVVAATGLAVLVIRLPNRLGAPETVHSPAITMT